MINIETDHDHRQTIRFTLPTLGMISSFLGAVVFMMGWIFGYMTFKSDINLITSQMADLKLQAGSIGMRLNELSEVVGRDREGLSNRMISLESEVKFISQGVAELKLKAAANGR